MGLEDKLEGNINEEILEVVRAIEKELPNGEVAKIQNRLEDVQTRVEHIDENQDKIQECVSDIQNTLNDPNQGVQVAVNKNSEFRKENSDIGERVRRQESRWKNFHKVMWAVVIAVLGLATRIIYVSVS